MNKLAVDPTSSWRGSNHDDGLVNLLQTETVLPSQFWQESADERSDPERRLLFAILEDALITLLQHRGREAVASRRLVSETEKWIASDQRCSPFEFVGLCDVLGVDPGYVRTLLRRLPTWSGLPQRRRSHAGRGHHKVRTPSPRRHGR